MAPPIATETVTLPTTTIPSKGVPTAVSVEEISETEKYDVPENMPYPPGYYASLEVVPDLTENSIKQLEKENYPYMHLLPHSPKGIQPPLVEFSPIDVGTRADPAMPNLLNAPGATFKELTPPLGTEVRGIQLLDLTSAQKDELALLIAQRGLLVFRDQNLKDRPPQELAEFGEHFGRLQTHQFGDYVKGYPGLTSVYRDAERKLADSHTVGNVSSVHWHTDMSYEINPVGTTFLAHLSGPPSGGDTIYANMVAAYEKLSPTFQEFLDKLSAVHSGVAQYSKAKVATGIIREPIETIHPVVRRHPVTGKKSLWVNKTYVRSIVGLKQEESDAVLQMLFAHIGMGQDFQLRVHWEPGSVVAYDNRITQHSALLDFQCDGPSVRRHLLRIQPHAERPRQ